MFSTFKSILEYSNILTIKIFENSLKVKEKRNKINPLLIPLMF